MDRSARQLHKSATKLVLVAAGMFGFAFALVPLYNIVCELTGINGKTAATAAVVDPAAPVSDREVTVQFLSQVNRGMPWEFRPRQQEMRVRVGEVNTALYYARNRALHTVTGQAVPSVTPGPAAGHLQKIECFCFTQQELAAGADMDMPVRFMVDAELPPGINTVSLSYTMYRVDTGESAAVAGHGPEHKL